MGYTTDFTGRFNLNKPLKPEHAAYLKAFSATRRMRRDAGIASTLPDPVREAARLPVGEFGCYFVGGKWFAGQDRDQSILDYNYEPSGQPGLWCQWVPTEDGTGIEWNGTEKFYEYIKWLEYLIAHFLKPWGYVLGGEVTWSGEDSDDMGLIVVKNNKVTTKKGVIKYE